MNTYTAMAAGLTLTSLLAGCEPNSKGVHYDPVGDWTPIAEGDWPGHTDFATDTHACTDETFAIMSSSTVTITGTFPDWKGSAAAGSLVVGDELPLEGELRNDIGAGSSFQSVDDAYLFSDGSSFLWADFYSDKTMRIGTTSPGKTMCWSWFDLVK